MAPYFSIILPIYNVAAYLERCVQSVLDQNFSDYELILVDDGSTDRSSRICDDLASQYPFIRVIHKENGGLSSARNAGAREARGQYIWWVDSDDWVEPNSLEILHRASCEDRPDMVKFNHIRCCDTTVHIESNVKPGFYADKRDIDQLIEKAFFASGKYVLSAWSHIYRRDFLENNSLLFVSERVIGSEDYLFNLEALLHTESVRVISDALYNYELRAGSLSQNYKKDLAERYTKLYIQLKEHYSDMGVLEQHEKRICSFYVWHLIHGTYIPSEYSATMNHSMEEGRSNIRAFFETPEFQYAVKHCAFDHFTLKQKAQLFAMRQRLEPVFHYLFVIKPKRKGGKHYENQN